MRIGIDARFFGPESKGLGRYTQKLITHLENIDQENDYVIFLHKDNFDAYTPHNPRFTKVCANYRWYSFAEQCFFPFVLYKHHCDIVHFPHFNVPLLYWKKYIVTIHDLILIHYPTRKASTRNALLYWCKFLCYRFVIFFAILRAAKVIAVSQFTKKDICQRYPRACKKTLVSYEAAEIMDADVANSHSKAHMYEKHDILEKYMLYVGNAYPHKNLHFLVDVFATYHNTYDDAMQLVLVGKNDYFYDRLARYIARKKVKNIRILYTVDDCTLQTLYQNASLFVFPSLYEGFGLPPLEAQLYGVPVVSSHASCMEEILSRDGAVYCDAKDVHGFADAIDRLMRDDAKQKKLIAHGCANARKYSWEKMAREIYHIYKTM